MRNSQNSVGYNLKISEALHNLNQRIEKNRDVSSREAQQVKRELIVAACGPSRNAGGEANASAVSSILSDMASCDRNVTLEQQLLHSLSFNRMRDRRQQIPMAHKNTFEWIFDQPGQGSRPGNDLNYWLKQQQGLYWLSGKAGSGKSTLMKFLQNHRQTREALMKWAGDYPLVIAGSYFWNPGVAMQKSQLGLFQTLMYEILQQCPSLIPSILPNRWRSYTSFGGDLHPWTQQELSEAFDLLGDQETISTKFCFFIDGLDEFDGKHADLIRTVISMSQQPNIKICASSRPWNIFEDAFAIYPKLFLQDLNRRDIEAYVNLEFNQSKQFQLLQIAERSSALSLVSEIVDKSAGVFLWVYLVVQSLLEGLSNADRIEHLQVRLRTLPEDLEDYFGYMLGEGSDLYLTQAAQLFRLVLEAQTPLSLLTLSYFDEQDPEYPFYTKFKALEKRDIQTRCENMRRRLRSRCKGLLEPRKTADLASILNDIDLLRPESPVAMGDGMEVDFLHRTVRDFLSTPTASSKLVAKDTEAFNAHITLIRALVVRLKGLSKAGNVRDGIALLWSLVGPAMYHAKLAESSSDASLNRLLNELDYAASHFWTSSPSLQNHGHHWSRSLTLRMVDQSAPSFLAFATHCGLEKFVTETLESDASLIGNHSIRPLLLCALADTSGLLSLDLTRLVSPDRRVPLAHDGLLFEPPNPRMIEILFERGADPNRYHSGFTVWEHLLRSIDQAKGRFVGNTDETQAWAGAVRLFIENGADPEATVPEFEIDLAERNETETFDSHIKPAIDVIKAAFIETISGPLVDLLEQNAWKTQRETQGPFRRSWVFKNRPLWLIKSIAHNNLPTRKQHT